MTLGEAIKNYRKENGYSQAELAELFRINPMTVSRLENDQPIRIGEELAVSIRELLGQEMLDQIDVNSRNLSVVRRRDVPKQTEHIIINDEIVKSCVESLKEVFSGYCEVLSFSQSVSFGDVLIQYGDKKWVLDIKAGQFNWERILNGLALGIGRVSMEQPINKFSLVWVSNNISDIQSLSPIQTFGSLNFDVSLLQYDLTKGKFDFEMDVSALFDGRGMFDARVPNKARESSLLYATWKSSLA